MSRHSIRWDHGLELMEAQRLTHLAPIGAFMQLMTLARDFVSSRIIHQWYVIG